MSLSMTRHSLDVMGAAWCISNVIFYWTSLCVILCTCRVSAVQHCLKNSTDGNRNCTLNGTCTGFPKLPTFPDVRLWPINTTRLIELVEPCLPDINFTTSTGTITYSTTPGNTQGTPQGTPQGNTQGRPLTTEKDSATVTSNDTDTLPSTTPTSKPNPKTTPKPTPKPGPNALLIVGIVVGCILAILAILAGGYYFVRKKNETCKVHSESDLDDKQADGNSLKPAAQGPDSTDKGIDASPAPPSGGGVIITPHEPDPKGPDAKDKKIDSSPKPATGGWVISTPHVPDPLESDESRNRTFSTGSRVGDTSILMPADSAGTSQAEPKKKKEKKKKKKEKKEKKEKRVKTGTKDIELPPVQPKEQANDQVKTADEVV
ncbi:uncharacterized transmembrane protein DDB_G0282483-like isoform X5 [Patiria miniata]|uniref:Uncharacterized protein n=1 Tax=Patiria miniata TaxID=46514 RepID=A0A913ZET6_PATMI|nr:uncharacterized transmembrane protein DDB_G0282483-like isoform X5 [Patiria miniata]